LHVNTIINDKRKNEKLILPWHIISLMPFQNHLNVFQHALQLQYTFFYPSQNVFKFMFVDHANTLEKASLFAFKFWKFFEIKMRSSMCNPTMKLMFPLLNLMLTFVFYMQFFMFELKWVGVKMFILKPKGMFQVV